ncbi:unnamed protein product [marine sediment metagenome]|uniref:YhcH/YjgK/YiaL family protein n=1 Tax=marine sediment metagenome TaxID=412755 RepID=X1UHI7_9ZZZZ
MVIDTFDNIERYKSLSNDIYEGLLFIKSADKEIEIGEYTINSKVKAIVSSYETVEVFTRGYEAHKKVIDIQYPIIGLERVKWSPIKDMEINIPYDDDKDRTFFKKPSKHGIHIDIGSEIFAIMFPEDGHSPQHQIGDSQLIKKITVKVSI